MLGSASQNSTLNSYYKLMGIFLILASIILLLFKNIYLNWREKSGDALFSRELRKTHELRFWIGIIFSFIFGIWHLMRYFY